MEFPQVDGAAPADSPLGQLERGRGAGWTQAAASESGSDLLLGCLRREPRWDRQVESRADYYATLAVHVSIPPSSFASLAFEGEEDDRSIVLDVLEAMARRGAKEASEYLQKVVHDDESVAALDQPAPRDKRSDPVAADAPIEQLLAADAWPPFRKAVVHRLRITTDGREVSALRQAAMDAANPSWRLALRVLALRGDSAPLHVVESILERDESGSIRASAFQYMRALPAGVSLPVARLWLSFDDGRGDAAGAVLANHAESSDASAIRDALAAASDYYAISDLVEALGRLPEAGPFPELDEVYEKSAYSYARARAVTAMAATDPDFANKWATESLWDSEQSVRVQGAKFAPLESAATQRLQQLAGDPFEDTEVREAVGSRLSQ